MLTWMSIAAGAVVALLSWDLYRRVGAGRITRLNNRRRAGARIVSRGELVEGNRQLAVALALTGSSFIYENADVQSSLDLNWVRDVEYDSETSTGRQVTEGSVLRLRCFSRTFEFVLGGDVAGEWQRVLPPYSAMGQGATREASAT